MHKRCQIDRLIPKMYNTERDITIPDLKLYYRTKMIKTRFC